MGYASLYDNKMIRAGLTIKTLAIANHKRQCKLINKSIDAITIDINIKIVC